MRVLTLHISRREIQKSVLWSPSLQTHFPVCSETAVPELLAPHTPLSWARKD